MRTMFVVSPGYLNAFFSEAKKYSFHLQGYGSFTHACSGIYKVNSADIMGIVYLDEKLPESGSAEYKYLRRFLRLCNLFEEQKKMVFISKNQQYLKKLAGETPRVKMSFIQLEEHVTDTVINKLAFGSILCGVETPYVEKIAYEPVEYEDNSIGINSVQWFDGSILKCLDTVYILQSYEDTLDNDVVYQECIRIGDTILALIRKKIILKKFHENTDRVDELIKALIGDIKSDERWCLVNALDRMVSSSA